MSGIGVTGGCQLLDVGLGAELGSSAGAEITLTLEPSLQPSVVLFTTPGGDANLGELGPEDGADERTVSCWSQLFSEHQTVCTLVVKKGYLNKVLMSSSCL